MYADMGVRNPVPLDELSTTNPQLFFQIKRDAELNVQRWMADGHGPLRRDPFHPHSQLPHGQFESPRSLSIRAPRGMSPSDSASASPHTAAKDQIKAFIAETVVSINMNQAQLVSSSLVDWSDLAARPESVRDPRLLGLRSASLKVAKRLDGLLSTIHIAPQLPALLFGNIFRAACEIYLLNIIFLQIILCEILTRQFLGHQFPALLPSRWRLVWLRLYPVKELSKGWSCHPSSKSHLARAYGNVTLINHDCS